MNEMFKRLQEASARLVLYDNMPDVILTEGGIQLNQYVASCSLGGIACNMTHDFCKLFHPYYLNCFTYRDRKMLPEATCNLSLSDPRNVIPEDDQPWLMSSLDNGLSLVVLTGSGMLEKTDGMVAEDLLPGLYDAGGATAGSDGVRVIIHPHDVLPIPFAEGFDVPPGFTASLGVRPRRNKRIGPPHGDCIDNDPFLSSSDFAYRPVVCQQRCLQQHVLEKCHCYDTSLPLPNIDPLDAPTCRTLDFPLECKIAELDTNEQCIETLLKRYKRVRCAKLHRERVLMDRAEMQRCGCRPACKELIYDVSFSMSRWPAPGFEGNAVYDDIFNVQRFRERFKDSETIRRLFNQTGDRTKALQDFARINVYVADPEVGTVHNV